ncbi:uncharacterized protein BO72DRAFT_485603 [Aspergillus fijiensis CBS 313.89]|uniref:Uncharacterized protein n=1 Tax=Aspergillus fijiensis CBS 313.89 TaxID=1448319 RepID=A0A8G1RUI5_9EURO|nr:uncharacterized protein BO72DRAFT_485603 [Aspergillus fijiensis CBS 313.89]RAK78100.1 hypothetical protein BO72DRAFT_485603 [Aspergillus fijiensis CBS 313.89]
MQKFPLIRSLTVNPRSSLVARILVSYARITSCRSMASITSFGTAAHGVGTHIHLDRSRWRIVSNVNEHVFPFDREDAETFDIRPYICARFRVRKVQQGPQEDAFMRVYKQIPILGSEFNTAEEIARQAKPQVPTEVKAFQRFSSLHPCPDCTPTLLDITSSVGSTAFL